MNPRAIFCALVAAALIALAVGCGSSSSSPSEVADLAPAGSPVFVEGTLQPSGELKSNTDAIAKQVAGIDNLGEYVVEKLESSARSNGKPVDFAREIEPWLGKRGGVFFEQLDEDDEFSGVGVIVESTDAAATQEFIDKHDKDNEGKVVSLVGDFLVVAEDQEVFDEVEEAADGESLGAEETFAKVIAAAPKGSLADVYVDVGKLIDQSGGQIDPTARQILQNAGIDPSEATAVASVLPGSDQIEVDLSADLAGQEVPVGNAANLLGQMPGNAFAAISLSGFGKQVKDAIDSLDEKGIPGTIPPGQLKKGLKELGIDLEGAAGSVQDAGVFAEGGSESTLGGSLVMATIGPKAQQAVANAGKLLRSVHVAGVTALSGKYDGFSVRSEELGDKPLVVLAKEGRAAIGYGLPATVKGLLTEAEEGKILSENPTYRDAVAALGDTPIGGFVNGPGALRLADSLISDTGFEEAKKYLKSIKFLALGTPSQDKLATAKLIIGLK
jgi:hypothetical protein